MKFPEYLHSVDDGASKSVTHNSRQNIGLNSFNVPRISPDRSLTMDNDNSYQLVDRCLYFFFLAIVLSVLPCTDSDYPFSIFWPLCCLSFPLQILIILVISANFFHFRTTVIPTYRYHGNDRLSE